MLLCNVNEKSCKLRFHPCLDIEQVRLGLKTTSGAPGMFTEGLLLFLLRLLPVSEWGDRRCVSEGLRINGFPLTSQ